MAEMTGKYIFQDWKTGEAIGRGSFGTVYVIKKQDALGYSERAAMKHISIPQTDSEIEMLQSEGQDEESITETFKEQAREILNEYQLMRKLNDCPNIVSCDEYKAVQHDHDLGWDIFIKMELLTPLLKLPKEQSLSEEQIRQLGIDLCHALVYCHQKNILHRDIKPQNIFVSADGIFKLGDFGIARIKSGTSTATAKIGTYDYMAPEVYHAQHYGVSADICSLGLVLYWLLNNRRCPFQSAEKQRLSFSEKEEARNRRFAGEPIPAPLNGSEELKQIVLKACAFDPKDRYQSAEEMLAELSKLGGARLELPPMPLDSDAGMENEKSVGDGSRIKETEGTVGLFGTADRAVADAGSAEDNRTVGVFDNLPQPKKEPTPKPASKPKKWPLVLGAVAALVLIAAGLYVLPGWEPATCESPETHKLFKITRGEALGHAYGDWQVIKEATCAEAGVEERVCANDPTHVEQREIPALGHAYGDWQVIKEATCAEAGVEERVCANDPTHVEQREIPMTEHTWLDRACDQPAVCAVCGRESESLTGHDWATEIHTIQTDDGITRNSKFIVCARCGEEIALEAQSSDQLYTAGDYTWFQSGSGVVIAKYTGNAGNLVVPEQLDKRSVVGIGDYAFNDCDSLTTVKLPSGVAGIGDYAFCNCVNLTAIDIPTTVTSIGDYAFSNCYDLTPIEIPSSVTSIGTGAFKYCKSLITIEIPASVTKLGENPFCYCSSLTSITVEEGNPAYTGIDGVLYTKAGDCLITYPYRKSGREFTIPSGVTSIGGSAFSGCDRLTAIEIPSGVVNIGDYAFSVCYGLTAIKIPSGVTSIGDHAFISCSGLTAIELPLGVMSIGEGAFSGCSGLTAIELPSGVTSLSDFAFSGCSALTTIAIPLSITKISWGAFSRCDGLTDVYYAGTKAQWDAVRIVRQNDALINATIHYNSK